MKAIRILALVLALLPTAATAKVPQVVAHRGYWNTEGSAQNSIRALVKADSIGVHAVELDVWITADDEIVLNHDPAINGVTVETATMDVLSQQRLRNGEVMPTLDRYLDTARTLAVDLVIEIKPHANPERELPAIQKVIEKVAARGLAGRVTYITFSRNAFDHLVRLSGRPVYFLTGVAPEVLAQIGGTGPDYHINVFRKNPDWLPQFKAAAMPVNVWTVSNAADLQYCIDNEVDYVTTDAPELALEMTAAAAQPVPLKIMSFNLRFGEKATLEEIAAVIKAENPDLVALQEVDVCTARAQSPHQNGRNFINELAALTGMFGQYARTINFAGGYYGIGILSRHPFESTRKYWLPNPSNLEPRVMLESVVELGGGRRMAFVATHFDYQKPETRLLQAQYLLDKVQGLDMPVVVAGDLNADAGDEAIDLLNASLKPLSCPEPTFPAHAPEVKLDHIFGAPAGSIALLDSAIPVAPLVSDHLPLISTITVSF